MARKAVVTHLAKARGMMGRNVAMAQYVTGLNISCIKHAMTEHTEID